MPPLELASTLSFLVPSLGSTMPLLLLLSESESGISESESGTCIIQDTGCMSLSRTSLSSKGSASTILSSKGSPLIALVGLP
ncbi:hypothetical protein AMTRI_Chr09g37270 [Amborella trichopoda]